MPRSMSLRTLSVTIATVLLGACGGSGGGSNSGGNNPFVLTGNLQTYSGIRGTTSATSTSTSPLTINGQNISWQASSTVPWITLPVTSGTAAGPLAFTVNPSALPVGTNEGTIRITDSNSGVTLNATVSVTVRALGFTVTPSTLTVSVDSTTTNVDPLSFTVADELNGQSGAAGYNWWVRTPSPHITATPTSGNTATTTPVTLQFTGGVLNAALSGTYSTSVGVDASGPGAENGSTAANVTVNASVQLPRAHAVYPHIVEPGARVVKLIGRNFQEADVARLRVNGAVPVSATRVSDRVIDVNLGVVAAGQYVFTFDNALSLPRSVAELTVTPRVAAGPGEIVSNRARQALRFDSHRGVLYASQVETDLIQRFSYDGANWQQLPAIAVDGVSGIDLSSNARFLYAAAGQTLLTVDLSQPTPVAAPLTTSRGNCGYTLDAVLKSVAALPTGTVHGYPAMTCRLNPSTIMINAFGADLLLGGEVLPPRDDFPNDDADLFSNQNLVLVSGDRRYVATPTSLWDSHTGQFLYTSQPLALSPWSMDLHATKILLGHVVVDRNGSALCTVPANPPWPGSISALSADGNRLYTYHHGSPGEILVLSTAQSGTPSAPGVCATAGPSIPVSNLGAVRPDSLQYGTHSVFAMTVSDDDSLLFLSGSERIVVIDLP